MKKQYQFRDPAKDKYRKVARRKKLILNDTEKEVIKEFQHKLNNPDKEDKFKYGIDSKYMKFMFNVKVPKTETEVIYRWNVFNEYCKEKQVPMTIERLASFMGVSRVQLLRWEKRERFGNVISDMKEKVLSQKTERLNDTPHPTGIIFDLKNNHGFNDESKVIHGGEVTFKGKLFEAIQKSKEAK